MFTIFIITLHIWVLFDVYATENEVNRGINIVLAFIPVAGPVFYILRKFSNMAQQNKNPKKQRRRFMEGRRFLDRTSK